VVHEDTNAALAPTLISSPPLELPIVATPPDVRERDRLIRRAKALSWLSLAYMTAEGAIAIAAAITASSVALLGFGLDSAIEALASIIVIWRFTGTRRLSDHAERRAQQLVAITFFLLAPYIAQDAIRTLINGHHPTTSWLGIGLSISSIIVMPLLGRAKIRVGHALSSGATAGEGNQNLLCAYLAAGVLTGLLLNLALGVWWADPAIALGIAAIAVNEGRHAWAGEDCCAASPIPTADGGGCHENCCR
jgi:divalent metal cation (Fe/Co/Zn/Cd) transporter